MWAKLLQFFAKLLAFLAFFAVISGDYVVVKFFRTYSMYNSTPPSGGQITPCTNPKFRAKKTI